jgi:hypothetical protein
MIGTIGQNQQALQSQVTAAETARAQAGAAHEALAAQLQIGVRPEVAQTLVSLGLELSQVQVARGLQSALLHR